MERANIKTMLVILVGVLAVAQIGCGSESDRCGSDDNCKGDRICVDGACVDPPEDDGERGNAGGNGEGRSEGASGEEIVAGTSTSGGGSGGIPQGGAVGLPDLGTCGDGVCSDDICETCARCPGDCGQCQEVSCECGDGTCDNYYCQENLRECPNDCSPPCGDGICDGPDGENPTSCSDDCGSDACGDGTCGANETAWCLTDCGGCGDGVCELAEARESTPGTPSCELDCAQGTDDQTCGDGLCSHSRGGIGIGEHCSVCPVDCGECNSCGNGVCGPVRNASSVHAVGSETCNNCPADCGECPPCGDGQCQGGEDCTSCPQDCGACGCGDGTCGWATPDKLELETWETCPEDCGGPVEGEYRNGNGMCEPGEDFAARECKPAQTCGKACANSCDCADPFTACSPEMGGLESNCVPVDCRICFEAGQTCCYADNCTGVYCSDDGTC